MEPGSKRKAALFVDFDNMFIGLQEDSPKAAEAFASDPARWIRWLEGGMAGAETVGHDGGGRTVLVRRCYLNPITFGRYRAYFTRSGFSVVDCPPLTAAGKNSADIVMVMDILDALDHDTRFDEFIVLSGDADFTPVFLRLRAYDRRTTALVSTPTAAAYRSACDLLIPEEIFVEKALGISGATERRQVAPDRGGVDIHVLIARRILEVLHSVDTPVSASSLPRVYREFPEFTPDSDWLGHRSLRAMTEAIVRTSPELKIEGNDQAWSVSLRSEEGEGVPGREKEVPEVSEISEVPAEAVFEFVRNLVADSSVPVQFALAAQRLIANFGPSLAESGWLGAGTFQRLMERGAGSGFAVTGVGGGYVLDPERHTRPEEDQEPARLQGLPEALADLIMRVHRLTDTPDISPLQYRMLFSEIAKELNEHGYDLVPTSKAVRDACAQAGESVSRAAVTFVLKGISVSGYRLSGAEAPHRPEDLAQAFHRNVLGLLEQARVELSAEEKELLVRWLLNPDS